MSSSAWYNSIYLPIALTCVSIVSLTAVLIISPNYLPINPFASSSSSPVSNEETPPASLASSNSLLSDASYSDDELPDASPASRVSSDTRNKNTVYTSDHSMPIARLSAIKTSKMAQVQQHSSVYSSPRGKPVKGRASNLHQVTSETSLGRHQIASSSSSSSPSLPSHNEDEEDDEEEKKAVNCHQAAVVRCGWLFLRTFKFLDFLPPGEAHPHKCAFRNAFFTCLKTIGDSKCVSIGKYYQPQRFRSRLARTLWNSKDCILGVDI